MTDPSDDLTPPETLEITANELERLDPVLEDFSAIQDGNAQLESAQMSDFKQYTQYLDRGLKRFQEQTKTLARLINELNQWWSIDDEDLTDEEINKLHDHLAEFETTVREIHTQYRDASRLTPPSDCEHVQDRFAELYGEIMGVADHMVYLVKTVVEDSEAALENEEGVTIDDENNLYMDFGSHKFDTDDVIEPYKEVYKQRKQSGDFGKVLMSGAMDLYMLNLFVDF